VANRPKSLWQNVSALLALVSVSRLLFPLDRSDFARFLTVMERVSRPYIPNGVLSRYPTEQVSLVLIAVSFAMAAAVLFAVLHSEAHHEHRENHCKCAPHRCWVAGVRGTNRSCNTDLMSRQKRVNSNQLRKDQTWRMNPNRRPRPRSGLQQASSNQCGSAIELIVLENVPWRLNELRLCTRGLV
jgi:hypothetical protein